MHIFANAYLLIYKDYGIYWFIKTLYYGRKYEIRNMAKKRNMTPSQFCNYCLDTPNYREIKEMRKSLLNADIVIVPTSISALDTKAIEYVTSVINDAKEFNEKLITYILINKATTNIFLHQDIGRLKIELDTLIKNSKDIYLLNSVISDRISYKRSISEGLSICEYKDEKAKDEFDIFYREFESSVKNNLGV